ARNCIILLFFFSSRRRHTRLQGDWSSDVCSSDLDFTPLLPAFLPTWSVVAPDLRGHGASTRETGRYLIRDFLGDMQALLQQLERSEERRVGKECRSRWSPDHSKKQNKNTKTTRYS